MRFRLLIAGFGHVGQSLARILIDRGTDYERRYGLSLEVAGVWDSGGACLSDRPLPLGDLLALKQAGRSVAEHSVYGLKGVAGVAALGRHVTEPGTTDVLVDLSPTSLRSPEPATAVVRAALARRMHVVMANKAPLVHAFRELHALADENECRIRFSGAVAAALPTASLALRDLAGSRILAIEGVLNGTTNYILTQMRRRGIDYRTALAEAQQRGIAERDPTLDVEGFDTAAKLTILCNATLGERLTLERVVRQGITDLLPADLIAAEQAGFRVKLVGRATMEGGTLRATVRPERLPLDHPLAAVENTEKGITFTTDLLGRVTVIGGGSGPTPAAASVIRDLISLRREEST